MLEMQNRVSTKPLDNVAGLAYLLYSHSIPIYDAEMSDEDAWEVLIDAMGFRYRADLLFYFPEPGMGRKCWRPSRQQIMMLKDFIPYSYCWPGDVKQTKDTDADWYHGYCIDSADVQGLGERQKEEKPPQGEMVFKDTAGAPHTFKILADHVYLIPDGSYALIDSSNRHFPRYDLGL